MPGRLARPFCSIASRKPTPDVASFIVRAGTGLLLAGNVHPVRAISGLRDVLTESRRRSERESTPRILADSADQRAGRCVLSTPMRGYRPWRQAGVRLFVELLCAYWSLRRWEEDPPAPTASLIVKSEGLQQGLPAGEGTCNTPRLRYRRKASSQRNC